MNPFCTKNFRTKYNVVPYGDHGTNWVNDETPDIYLTLDTCTDGMGDYRLMLGIIITIFHDLIYNGIVDYP